MSQTWTAILIWIHLAAIVTWLGLIINSAFVFFPAIDGLTPAERAVSLSTYRKKAITVSVIAVTILFIVGITLVIVTRPSEQSLIAPWTTLIFIKHALIFAMLSLQGFAVFSVQPRIIGLLTASVGALGSKQENQVFKLSSLNRNLAFLTSIAGFAVLLVISFVVTFY
jgi:hypothetical protein